MTAADEQTISHDWGRIMMVHAVFDRPASTRPWARQRYQITFRRRHRS